MLLRPGTETNAYYRTAWGGGGDRNGIKCELDAVEGKMEVRAGPLSSALLWLC